MLLVLSLNSIPVPSFCFQSCSLFCDISRRQIAKPTQFPFIPLSRLKLAKRFEGNIGVLSIKLNMERLSIKSKIKRLE
jgi:hypothetical protein